MHAIVKSPRALLPPILFLTVVLTAIFLPVEQIMTGVQNWAETNQSSAVFIVTAGIVLGTLLLLPLSLMTMLAGFLFVYLGTTVSDIAAIINGNVRLEGTEMLVGLTALLVVIGLVLLIVRVAGKTLKEELLAARE